MLQGCISTGLAKHYTVRMYPVLGAGTRQDILQQSLPRHPTDKFVLYTAHCRSKVNVQRTACVRILARERTPACENDMENTLRDDDTN